MLAVYQSREERKLFRLAACDVAAPCGALPCHGNRPVGESMACRLPAQKGLLNPRIEADETQRRVVERERERESTVDAPIRDGSDEDSCVAPWVTDCIANKGPTAAVIGRRESKCRSLPTAHQRIFCSRTMTPLSCKRRRPRLRAVPKRPHRYTHALWHSHTHSGIQGRVRLSRPNAKRSAVPELLRNELSPHDGPVALASLRQQ